MLGEHAIDGKYNPGRPFAFAGQIVICLTLLSFWIVFASQIISGRLLKRIVQISGTLAMMIAIFLSPNAYHDLVVTLASVFGLIATFGIFVGLLKNRWYGLVSLGIFNIFLIVLNHYVYYHNQELLVYLPLIQEISFAAFLIWISCITIKLYRRSTLN